MENCDTEIGYDKNIYDGYTGIDDSHAVPGDGSYIE